MHLIAIRINFVLIHMVAMSVSANLVSIELEANVLMSTNVRKRLFNVAINFDSLLMTHQ